MDRQLTAALYVRVSTQDQDHDRQTHELREYARRMDWQVIEYAEKQSAVKKRPVLDRLMEDARMKRFDLVLVLALDRFGRSLVQLINNVETLTRYGVRFIAVSQGIDTDKKSPMGNFIIQMFGAFAEFERAIIIERVRSGVAEAQRKGKHCGRPKRIWSRDQARLLQKQGLSLRQIAAQIGVSHVTIATELRAVKKV